jgi:hypothetical protein
MHWALALGEEPERTPPSKTNVKRSTTWPRIHRRLQQKWESRIEQILCEYPVEKVQDLDEILWCYPYSVLQFADMRNSYLIKQESRRP